MSTLLISCASGTSLYLRAILWNCCAGSESSEVSPVAAAPYAVGLSSQTSIVRNMLLSNGEQYVAILGLGDIGKISLSQIVVNNLEVKSVFPKQAFVTVSQDPHIAQCQRRILQDLKGRSAQIDFVSNEDGTFGL